MDGVKPFPLVSGGGYGITSSARITRMQPQPTERLRFRPVNPEDAAVLNALNNAPGVMQYLDREPPTFEHLRTQEIPKQERIAAAYPGFGMWLAFQNDPEECIGWFKLEPDHPNLEDAEIGYRLFPEFWGKGLATEGARELLRFAFDDLAVSRCVAVTMSVNRPSRSVMESIGLRYVRTIHEEFEDPLPGTEEGEVEYALTMEEWLLRRA